MSTILLPFMVIAKEVEVVSYGNKSFTLNELSGLGTKSIFFDPNESNLYWLKDGTDRREIQLVEKKNGIWDPKILKPSLDFGWRSYWSSTYSTDLKSFLLVTDEIGDEKFNIYIWNPRLGKLRKLTDLGYTVSFIEDLDKIIHPGRVNQVGGRHCLYESSTGEKVSTVELFCDQKGWTVNLYDSPILSPDQNFIAHSIAVDGSRSKINIVLFNRQSKQIEMITDPSILKSRASPIAWFGSKIFYAASKGTGDLLYSYDTITKVHKIQNPDILMGNLEIPVTNRLVLKLKNKEICSLAVFDLATETISIEKPLPCAANISYSRQRDLSGGIYFNATMGPKDRTMTYYLNSLAKTQNDLVDSVLDMEKDIQLLDSCEVERFSYPTFDTDQNNSPRQIEAFLFKPKFPVKDLAGIVYPHGGPTGQTTALYPRNIRALCALGYFVIGANVRGSSGYGQEFQDMNDNDWAGGDFLDYEYSRRYLRDRFQIPEARIGIFGFSYGGYMAAWAATRTDSKYGFAIAGAPITDLFIQAKESVIPDNIISDMGNPDASQGIYDLYKNRSPMTWAHQLEIPILMLHGSQDLRDPVRQTQLFHSKLVGLNKKSTYVELKGEGHGIYFRENLNIWFQSIFDFLWLHAPIRH